jgi:hypothetical protein
MTLECGEYIPRSAHALAFDSMFYVVQLECVCGGQVQLAGQIVDSYWMGMRTIANI